MFLGVEDGYWVPGIIGIGLSSVASLGVPGLFANLIPAHRITVSDDLITGAIVSVLLRVASMLPSRRVFGSDIYVNKLSLT